MNDFKVVRTESRHLPVKLDDHELRERGDQLAAVIQDMNTEEKRQTDAKAGMKARLAELDAKKTQLAITIARHEEDRDITVDVIHRFDKFIVESVRQDTGEVVTSRPMTEIERQQTLPIHA